MKDEALSEGRTTMREGYGESSSAKKKKIGIDSPSSRIEIIGHIFGVWKIVDRIMTSEGAGVMKLVEEIPSP